LAVIVRFAAERYKDHENFPVPLACPGSHCTGVISTMTRDKRASLSTLVSWFGSHSNTDLSPLRDLIACNRILTLGPCIGTAKSQGRNSVTT
jgi:hypothetical protein